MTTLEHKRQKISIGVKKQIIDESEKYPQKSFAKLAKEFRNSKRILKKSNIRTILKDKEKILEAINDGIGAKRLQLTVGQYANQGSDV